jgi:hypothetical protein
MMISLTWIAHRRRPVTERPGLRGGLDEGVQAGPRDA